MTFTRRSVSEHQNVVTELMMGIPRPVERATVREIAFGSRRTLAADLVAEFDMPTFDNSQMDGFAVRAADVRAATEKCPVELRVTGHMAAGDHTGLIGIGEAWAVMTGASIPDGADAVIPIEESNFDSFPDRADTATLRVSAPCPVGRFIRRRGSDIRGGERIVSAGSPVTSALVGALASSGIEQLDVKRPLTALIVATGSELRRPGAPDRPGSILDANTLMLTSLLTSVGVRVLTQESVPDDPDELLRVLDSRFGEMDLIVTAGGVSKGAHEVVRDCLEQRGIEFGSVAMQPGGPQGVGTAHLASGDVPVVALPGNPVSALVSAEVFLRPALLAASGRWAFRSAHRGPLAEATSSPAGTLQVRRGRQREDGRITFEGGPSSHLLHAFARSTVLVFIPPERTSMDVGDIVEFWRIND
ncbi:MAG: gephyrin-like molybdotransferase Glp [Mycobacterium sp.]